MKVISKLILTVLGIVMVQLANGQTPLHSGTQVYYINSNLGVGTNSPLSPLHINTATNLPVTSALMENSSTLISGRDGNLELLSFDDNTSVSNNISFGRYNESTGAIIHKFGITTWANTGSQGSNTGSKLSFSYGTQANIWANPNLMVIEADGDVGIGIESPTAKVHLQDGGQHIRFLTGSNSSGYKLDFGVNDDGVNIYNNSTGRGFNFKNGLHNDLLTIEADGNIGIGTTSPKSALTIGHFTGDNIETTGLTFGTDHRNIEFIHSSWSDGFGSKIYNTDEGAGITSLRIATRGNTTQWTDAFYIEASNKSTNGNIGIGTNDPNDKLEVNGTIRSKKIRVEASNWPDYVFRSDFKLIPLDELEGFINLNKHLPDVPSAKEVEKEGIDLGEMNATLLKKIEELTLYMIEMKKEVEMLKKKNKQLEQKVNR